MKNIYETPIGVEWKTVGSLGLNPGEEPKEGGPGLLPPLDPDDEIISEYITTCPTCKEDYRERKYIAAAGRLFVSERGPCSCMPEKGESTEERLQRSWRYIQRALGKCNLVTEPGLKLEDFVPLSGQEAAFELARLYLRSDAAGKSLLITGPPGRGKTELALALARSAAGDRTVAAIKSVDLLDRIRRSLWEEKHKNELVALLREVDLLVIDDVGVEKATDWVLATLYSIIDYRYGRKDTVYTSNLTGKQMIAKLGEALTSRIWGSRRVMVSGQDWRIEKRQRHSSGWDREEELQD